jgi:hypothetical protein
MNLYTDTKQIECCGFEIPTVMFQSKCWIYYTFATVVAGYWANRKLK